MFAQPIIMKYPGIKISGRPKISIHTAKQERKCAFLFPIPSSFPLGFGGGPGPQPPAPAFPRCKMRFTIRHSFCTAPLHAQRAMVCGRKNFGNPKQETIAQLPAGKYGQGNISLSRMQSGRKQTYCRLCRKNSPIAKFFSEA